MGLVNRDPNNEAGWRLATMNEIEDNGPHATPERLLAKPTEGWTYLYNSPKWHYFRGGRALCKRWMTFGNDFEQGNDTSPDNCKGCVKVLEKEQVKK